MFLGCHEVDAQRTWSCLCRALLGRSTIDRPGIAHEPVWLTDETIIISPTMSLIRSAPLPLRKDISPPEFGIIGSSESICHRPCGEIHQCLITDSSSTWEVKAQWQRYPYRGQKLPNLEHMNFSRLWQHSCDVFAIGLVFSWRNLPCASLWTDSAVGWPLMLPKRDQRTNLEGNDKPLMFSVSLKLASRGWADLTNPFLLYETYGSIIEMVEREAMKSRRIFRCSFHVRST